MKKFIRKDEEAVSPVIAVILMVAITVVLAGVLWAMLSSIKPGETGTEATLKTRGKEKGTIGWQITVDSVSGDLKLDDANFRLIDADNIQQWEKTVNDVNPAKFKKGDSYVYPIPSGTTPVRDNATGIDVTSTASFEKYELCYMAYIDSDADEKVSSGDALWVYKDYDSDGTLDFTGSYTLEFKDGNNNLVGSEKL